MLRRNPAPLGAQEEAAVEEAVGQLLAAIHMREQLPYQTVILVCGCPLTRADLDRLALRDPDELRAIGRAAVAAMGCPAPANPRRLAN